MGLKNESVNYFIFVRNKDERIITDFNDTYFLQLLKEGWKRVDSFNVKQNRAIQR